MARDHARINVTIWNDAEFRKLPPDAQALYLTLWTSPTLSYCGVHDWRPCRLAALSGGSTAESIRTTAKVLIDRHFLVVDEDTEEVLVRSWMRFDGLLKQPRLAVSCVAAYAAVASANIRAVVVSELYRIRTSEPELACWSDARMLDLLHQPQISARDLAAGYPIGPGLALVSSKPEDGLAQTTGDVSIPPTPSPTPGSLLPTPSSLLLSPTPATQNGSRRKPASDEDAALSFEAFWDLYPRKDDKGHAKRAWVKACKATTPEVIMDGLRAHLPKLQEQHGKGFGAYAATWLNGERWADALPEPERKRDPRVPEGW